MKKTVYKKPNRKSKKWIKIIDGFMPTSKPLVKDNIAYCREREDGYRSSYLSKDRKKITFYRGNKKGPQTKVVYSDVSFK